MELALMTKDDLVNGIKEAYCCSMERLKAYVEDMLQIKQVSSGGLGKILVLGQAAIKQQQAIGYCKSLGIAKERLEFCCDYSSLKKHDIGRYQYNSNHSLIIVSAMPHSMKNKGSYSSSIAKMEQEPGFPPIVRASNGNSLKLSLSGFKQIIREKLDDGCIVAA